MTKIIRNGLALPRDSRRPHSNLRFYAPRMSNTGLLAIRVTPSATLPSNNRRNPPTSVGADDDEVGWPPLRLLFNRVVNMLTEHLDNDQRRIKFNSCFTYDRRTVRDYLLACRSQRVLVFENIWRLYGRIGRGSDRQHEQAEAMNVGLARFIASFSAKLEVSPPSTATMM